MTIATKDDLAAKDALIKHLERENRALRETMLDHFAQAALASGRYAYNQVYDIARNCLQERKNYVGS